MSFAAPKQHIAYNSMVYRPSTAKPMASDYELKFQNKVRVNGPSSSDYTKLFQSKQRVEPPRHAEYKLFQHEIKKSSNIANGSVQYMSNCQSERSLFDNKKRVEAPVSHETKLFTSKYQVAEPIKEVRSY